MQLYFHFVFTVGCLPGEFKCNSGYGCIAEEQVCDSLKQCIDGSDEDGCGKSLTLGFILP